MGLPSYIVWAASLVTCFHLSVAFPQSQNSTGNYSPNITAGRDAAVTFEIHNYDLKLQIPQLSKRFAQQPDKDSRQIGKLLEQGNFDQAIAIIDRATRRLSNATAELAFLQHSKGVISFAQRRYFAAEQAFGAAVALAPDSCKYRGDWAISLVALDRLAEANRVVGLDTLPAMQCAQKAEPLDRARLLLPQVRIALEQRDEVTATRLVRQFEAVMAQVVAKRPDASEWSGVLLSCSMYSIVREAWRYDPGKLESFRSKEQCIELGKKVDRRGLSSGLVLSTDAVLDESGTRADGPYVRWRTEAISAQIDSLASSTRIGALGFDENQRAVSLAGLYLARGFNQLWQGLDSSAARSDYRRSYEILRPLASPTEPVALRIYANLATKILHFEEIFPEALVLENSKAQFAATVRDVIDTPFDATPDSCSALQETYSLVLSKLASQLTPDDVVRLKGMVQRCVKTGLTERSLISESISYSIVAAEIDHRYPSAFAFEEDERRLRKQAVEDSKLAKKFLDDEAKLSELIANLDRRSGFPVYAERSQFMWYRLQQRARIRNLLGDDNGANADLVRAVTLSREYGGKLDVALSLLQLSHHLIHHDGQPSHAAFLADEAFALRRSDSREDRPRTCWDIFLTIRAGQQAAGTWLVADRPDKAVENMKAIEELSANRTSCRGFSGVTETKWVNSAFALAGVDASRAAEVIQLNEGRSLKINTQLLDKYAAEMLEGDSRQDRINFPLIFQLRAIAVSASSDNVQSGKDLRPLDTPASGEPNLTGSEANK